MADIKLGNKTFEGVEKVMLDTTDGNTATYVPEGAGVDLTPIVEAVESVGGTVETTDINGLVAAVASLDVQINPWEEITEAGTDALGDYDFDIDDYKGTNPVSKYGYWKIKKGFTGYTHAAILSTYHTCYDMTNAPEDFRTMLYQSAKKEIIMCTFFSTNQIKRLILPENCTLYGALVYGVNAVYLPKHSPSIASNWVSQTYSNSGHVVKCPPGADVPYYLNRLPAMTAEDIVGIFENMIDRSGETTVATITLGSDNLAKLTEEQIAIAEAKGWNLA